MSLPFVISTVKTHSMQIKHMRENCIPKVFKNYDLNRDAVPNITSSKVHLHSRKSSRLTRRKVKKKRSSHLVKVPKVTESETHNVSRNKNKENQGKQNAFISTKSHSTTKDGIKSNVNDLNTSSSVVICSVRKLISSYSTKNTSTLPHTMWKNQKISSRPKTSGGKTREKQISEIKIKRQSCPPPLFQPSESPVSKNVKLRKVYYSEAQSHMLAGVPGAPPCTPLNDNLVAVEIVPCLADIKSQQAIKTKLKYIVTQRQRADEKLREKILQDEKRKEKEEIESLKQQRRAEIYALNEVMTAHERSKFLLFMKEKNNGATTISLKV